MPVSFDAAPEVDGGPVDGDGYAQKKDGRLTVHPLRSTELCVEAML